MKKLFISFFLVQNAIFSQNSVDTIYVETVSDKILTKCFENLTPLKEFDSLPEWKNHKFCSLLDHLYLLQMVHVDTSLDKKTHTSVINRLGEISSLLYLDKTAVILTFGMDSSYEADLKNKNTDDDNKIIYVSIGECTIPRFWYEGIDAFNSETRKLLKN